MVYSINCALNLPFYNPVDWSTMPCRESRKVSSSDRWIDFDMFSLRLTKNIINMSLVLHYLFVYFLVLSTLR